MSWRLSSLRQRKPSVSMRYTPLDGGHSRTSSLIEPVGPSKEEDQTVPPARGTLLERRPAVVTAIIVGVLLLAGLVFNFRGQRTSTSPHVSYKQTQTSSGEARAQYLRLLMPASHSSPNLCKSLFSGAVLNYPPAMLVTWDRPENEYTFPAKTAPQMVRMKETLKFLNSLETPRHDDDLVIYLDGRDIWWQLRPDVLVKRWWRLISEGNARLESQLGQDNARSLGVKQKVIFPAQKRCNATSHSSPACFAVPFSPLPDDIYGLSTSEEKTADTARRTYQNVRPRYLNSGSAIGTVSALRALFQRADEKANKHAENATVQMLLAEIYGEQEFARQALRQRNPKLKSKAADQLSEWRSKYGQPGAESDYLNELSSGGLGYEFGIGLDYWNELIQPKLTAEENEKDAVWAKFSDSFGLMSASKDAEIFNQRAKQLPEDIKDSSPPFWSYSGGHVLPVSAEDEIAVSEDNNNTPPAQKLLQRKRAGIPDQYTPWEDVPLHTNLRTGIVPAAVHYDSNLRIVELEDRLALPWDSIWFRPHLRRMFELTQLEPVTPLASITLPPPPAQLPLKHLIPIDDFHQAKSSQGLLQLDEEDMKKKSEQAKEMVYWPDYWDRVGPRKPAYDANKPWDQFFTYEWMCAGEQQGNEIFGDGRGKIRSPKRWPYENW